MLQPAERKALMQRTHLYINHIDTFQTIIDTVANGGSLVDLCEKWNIQYSTVIQWVNSDAERQKLYNQAVRARGEWFIQTVLREIARIGLVDIAQAYDSNGALKDINDMPVEVRSSIAGVESVDEYDDDGIKTGTVRKVKFYDKNRALELLGKNFYMFVDKHIHEVITPAPKMNIIDIEERIRRITHATVVQMEAEQIASDKPKPPTE